MGRPVLCLVAHPLYVVLEPYWRIILHLYHDRHHDLGYAEIISGLQSLNESHPFVNGCSPE